jgi:D-inositol-3-phosphate glycosyltransferase
LDRNTENRHIGLVCFIADPFDPPGHERYGGGHLFIFDLGRFLVQQGYRISFFTRRNNAAKPMFDELGSLCSIFRLDVGPPVELPPATVGTYVDALFQSFEKTVRERDLKFSALHSHYWIAGEVVRRFRAENDVRHIHSVLSLGRVNREKNESLVASSPDRESREIAVMNSADAIIVVCPSELADVERLYPEVDSSRVHTIPYGVDPDEFYPRPQSESDFVRRQTLGFP